MTTKDSNHLGREARLQWVPIALMKVSPLAQRDLNQSRVDKLAADFDLEMIGTPTVSKRDEAYYIIDGQHRVEALKAIGWGDQQIQCWTYQGLTEEDESEKFLKLGDFLPIDAMSKFRIGVNAGRADERDIDRIVRAQGLCVSADRIPGAVGAVGTLRRIYTRSDGKVLARALRITRDAYGDIGMKREVLDGMALLCQRYNGDLSEEVAVQKLASANGGLNGLLNKADVLHRSTGNAKGHCVAAAAVEIINTGRGGKKLPSWWKADA